MSEYSVAIEPLHDVYPELEPIFRAHYAEYSARLSGEGVEISPYKPRLDQYFAASRGGWLITFVMRCDGKAVGYSVVYVSNDMHNGDLIAREDTIFALPDHRRGAGRKLMVAMIDHLRTLGVKRGFVSATTDPRVSKLWERMGFKPLATQLVYIF